MAKCDGGHDHLRVVWRRQVAAGLFDVKGKPVKPVRRTLGIEKPSGFRGENDLEVITSGAIAASGLAVYQFAVKTAGIALGLAVKVPAPLKPIAHSCRCWQTLYAGAALCRCHLPQPLHIASRVEASTALVPPFALSSSRFFRERSSDNAKGGTCHTEARRLCRGLEHLLPLRVGVRAEHDRTAGDAARARIVYPGSKRLAPRELEYLRSCYFHSQSTFPPDFSYR